MIWRSLLPSDADGRIEKPRALGLGLPGALRRCCLDKTKQDKEGETKEDTVGGFETWSRYVGCVGSSLTR